jgi:hypothetical protein
MTERYDHRTDEARAADAEEPMVIDHPLEEGAADLQQEVVEADREGDVEHDPAGPDDHPAA